MWSGCDVCGLCCGSWCWWEHVVNNSRHTAGPGQGREWEKYFSCVVTTLFHDLQWDYIMRAPYSRWFIASVRNEKKICSLRPQRWLLLWRSERGPNVIMSMIKCRESYDPGKSQKLQNTRIGIVSSVPWDVRFISKHSIFNPFSIRHQIKKLKC